MHVRRCSLFAFVSTSIAQQNQQDQADDVLRINTELVQTGVTVFDKQGHFVEGLKYLLKVTITDRNTNTNASQQLAFYCFWETRLRWLVLLFCEP